MLLLDLRFIFFSYLKILMKNTFFLQQISKTGNFDSFLMSRQYKLNLMTKFMQKKFENPIMKQSEIADKKNYSSSTLQRNKDDIKHAFTL